MFAFDGTGRQTIHMSTGERRVHSIWANGDDVFFLEENEDAAPVSEVFKVPFEGGVPTRLGAATFSEARIFGVDRGSVFISAQGENFSRRYVRVDVMTGEVQVAASTTEGSTPLHVQLAGDEVYFEQGVDDVASLFQFARDGLDATPTQVGAPGVDPACFLPVGAITLTPTKLLCGYSEVAAFDRDGTHGQVILQRDELVRRYLPVATFGEDVIVLRPGDGRDRPGQLSRLSTAGVTPLTLARDLGITAHRFTDDFFPNTSEWPVVVLRTAVYFVEVTPWGTDGAETYHVRRVTL